MHKLTINMLFCHLGLLLVMAAPALSLDQVIKLYICQTEHDLEEITSCEYSDPEKYRAATMNGRMTPLDAAQESAGSLIAMDKVMCDQDKNMVIEKYQVDGNLRKAYQHRVEGSELERYCPRTIKKYGHPCR
jgi:hypothetical protein